MPISVPKLRELEQTCLWKNFIKSPVIIYSYPHTCFYSRKLQKDELGSIYKSSSSQIQRKGDWYLNQLLDNQWGSLMVVFCGVYTHVFSNELRVFKENELLIYFLINYACRDSKQTTSLFSRITTEMQSRVCYTMETIKKIFQRVASVFLPRITQNSRDILDNYLRKQCI